MSEQGISEQKQSGIDGERFAIELARLASDDKCSEVVVLDVRGLSQITDYLVIASGTSDRQEMTVLSHAQEYAESVGQRALGVHRDTSATWLLADFVSVVLHVFEPNTRANYDLEMLWGDARRVKWERDGTPAPVDRNRAGLTADDIPDSKGR